jgi:hypothetical protein
MLPYYMRHYEPIADRFVVFDDASTDGSVEFLKHHPKVEIRSFNNGGSSYIERSRDLWNQCWKESRGKADWVIICNMDEHLYHNDLLGYLKRCRERGITILPSQGYEMISNEFPSVKGRLCDKLVLGSSTRSLSGPSGLLSKIAIFDPNTIEEINYSLGRHRADPKGKVVYPKKTELKILHYKFLGLKYLEQRYSELKQGLSSDDITKKRGVQYLWDRSTLEKNFRLVEARAAIVVNSNFFRGLSSFICFLPGKIKALPFLLMYYLGKAIGKLSQKLGKQGRDRAL